MLSSKVRTTICFST